LLLVIIAAFGIYVRRINQRAGWQIFPLMIMSLFLIVFLSQITANLGIAVRQKWMALVPLFVVLATAMRGRYDGQSPVSSMPRFRGPALPQSVRQKHVSVRPR
jgi:hypothetical protein